MPLIEQKSGGDQTYFQTDYVSAMFNIFTPD